jgi:hypothetical protein
MNYVKIKNKEHLLRDCNTNAIVNSDHSSYLNYVNEYKKRHNNQQKINDIESDIISIKNDLNEIKQLLRNIKNGS